MIMRSSTIVPIALGIALIFTSYTHIGKNETIENCREAVRIAENTVSLHELAHSTSDLGQYESFLFGAREQDDRFQRLADDC